MVMSGDSASGLCKYSRDSEIPTKYFLARSSGSEIDKEDRQNVR